MKIKECKKYFNSIVDTLNSVSKKKKFIATIFVIIIGLMILMPLVCIYINLFMQFLGIKWLMTLTLISCGVIVHVFLSLLYPVYFIALNELNKDISYIDKISYKKIFLTLITDWLMIMFFAVIIFVLVFIVNIMLF